MFSVCFLYITYCKNVTFDTQHPIQEGTQTNSNDDKYQIEESIDDPVEITFEENSTEYHLVSEKHQIEEIIDDVIDISTDESSIEFDYSKFDREGDSEVNEQSSCLEVYVKEERKNVYHRSVSVSYVELKTGWRAVCTFSNNVNKFKLQSVMLVCLQRLR